MWHRSRRLAQVLLVAVVCIVVQNLLLPTAAQEVLHFEDYTLPTPQVHPLPETLATIPPNDQGDYFEAIAPVAPGYLVWSQFPVTVYVESPTQSAGDRSAEWVQAVHQAIQEWASYLPLTIVTSSEAADITILRRNPPLRREQGSFRARSAETRYELYARTVENQPTLSQRFTIWLRPAQSLAYLQAAARHELGHALGIWGHSSIETDALYPSQVRQPALISARDVNTLKKLYSQPTRLGWPLQNR